MPEHLEMSCNPSNAPNSIIITIIISTCIKAFRIIIIITTTADIMAQYQRCCYQPPCKLIIRSSRHLLQKFCIDIDQTHLPLPYLIKSLVLFQLSRLCTFMAGRFHDVDILFIFIYVFKLRDRQYRLFQKI
jgi:hypothetical protein